MKTFLDLYNEAVTAGATGEDAARQAQEKWAAAQAAELAAATGTTAALGDGGQMPTIEPPAKPELRAEDINVSRIPVQVLQQAGCTNGMSDEDIAARCLPMLVSLGW
jgi:hypothetical protein